MSLGFVISVFFTFYDGLSSFYTDNDGTYLKEMFVPYIPYSLKSLTLPFGSNITPIKVPWEFIYFSHWETQRQKRHNSLKTTNNINTNKSYI